MNLNWFFQLPPFLLIFIVSLLLTFIITLVYKFTTNQKEMKQLKDDLNKYQKEMKESKDDAKKVMEMQKKAMEVNMKYMMHSFKSNLYTFLPLILIFGWLNTFLVYQPLMPNTPFNVTAYTSSEVTLTSEPELSIMLANKTNTNVTFTLSGTEGNYALWFKTAENQQASKEIEITTLQKYKAPEMKFKEGSISRILVHNKPTRPFGENFNLFGWHPGWLGTYVILSLVFSILVRKVLKVY